MMPRDLMDPSLRHAHDSSSSLRVLLCGLIDYAGLFPPAKLDMSKAVENYAAYLESEQSWMLGRFIVPVSRLEEFRAAQLSMSVGAPWMLSVLLGSNVEADIQTVASFNRENDSEAVVDVVEGKVGNAAEIERAQAHIPEFLTAYWEIPLSSSAEMLIKLRSWGGRAKVRTGGVLPELIPASLEVAKFLVNCAAAGAAFKATAGLHHPVRCVKPLTYEPNAATGKMHGFINLVCSAGLVFHRHPIATIEQALSDEDQQSFSVSESGIEWCGTPIPNERIRTMREQLFVSFGSCSFEDPVQELRALNWL